MFTVPVLDGIENPGIDARLLIGHFLFINLDTHLRKLAEFALDVSAQEFKNDDICCFRAKYPKIFARALGARIKHP